MFPGLPVDTLLVINKFLIPGDFLAWRSTGSFLAHTLILWSTHTWLLILKSTLSRPPLALAPFLQRVIFQGPSTLSISELEAWFLAIAPHVRELTLRRLRGPALIPYTIPIMPQLHTLTLGEFSFGFEIDRTQYPALQSLTTLYSSFSLSQCQLTNFQIYHNRERGYLGLDYAIMRYPRVLEFHNLNCGSLLNDHYYPHLEELSIINGRNTDSLISTLNPDNLPQLRLLNLRQNLLTEKGVTIFLNKKWLTLKTLDLSENPFIRQIGLQAFRPSHFPALQCLRLNHQDEIQTSVQEYSMVHWQEVGSPAKSNYGMILGIVLFLFSSYFWSLIH